MLIFVFYTWVINYHNIVYIHPLPAQTHVFLHLHAAVSSWILGVLSSKELRWQKQRQYPVSESMLRNQSMLLLPLDWTIHNSILSRCSSKFKKSLHLIQNPECWQEQGDILYSEQNSRSCPSHTKPFILKPLHTSKSSEHPVVQMHHLALQTQALLRIRESLRVESEEDPSATRLLSFGTSITISTFRVRLKTFLFAKAYSSAWSAESWTIP